MRPRWRDIGQVLILRVYKLLRDILRSLFGFHFEFSPVVTSEFHYEISLVVTFALYFEFPLVLTSAFRFQFLFTTGFCVCKTGVMEGVAIS